MIEFEIDELTNTAMLYLTQGKKSAHTIPVDTGNGTLVLDFDADFKIISMEFVMAKEMLPKDLYDATPPTKTDRSKYVTFPLDEGVELSADDAATDETAPPIKP